MEHGGEVQCGGMHTLGSEYLHWVKTRTPGRFNLANSGVMPCCLSDLGARPEDVEINDQFLNGFDPLVQAVAEHNRVSPGCVVTASGTSGANFIAMAALIQPGDEVVIEHPVYEPLLAAARYFGAEIKRFPRDRGIRDYASSRTKLIVTTNLHNPTCEPISRKELGDLASIASDIRAFVLVDEVYSECLYDRRSSAFHEGDRLVCTGSLTKAYGLGGLRCGWIVAQPDLASRMWRIKELVEPSAPHPSERLSVLAFQKLGALAHRARTLLDRNRALLIDFVRSCPQVEVTVPDHGTCVFPRLKTGGGDRFFDALHDRYDTDVVPGRFFENPDHFRLGIGGDTPTVTEGLQRLRSALQA